MRPARNTRRGSDASRASAGELEWVGGMLSPPFFVNDREEPYRVKVALWMELPSGLIVGQEMLPPEQVPGAVGRVLRAGFEQPLAGPPRRPARIRVAEAHLAAEVLDVVGDEIPLTVAPTPELDTLLAQMVDSLPNKTVAAPSYLEGGRIPDEAVSRLFGAARLLYGVKPWETATDDQVLRMDIPALGVDGACVSIVGNLGESLGVIVFPSFAGYEAFTSAAEHAYGEHDPIDLGTEWLALSFERGADLPASLRREVTAHGWPVEDVNAYPCLEHRDRDGTPRPLVARDLAIATACATSLTAFFLKHADAFAVDDPVPICESWFDEDDLEVRFTLPYEAFVLFDVAGEATAASGRADASDARTAGPHARRPGRNAPCPCGSGRKYKKCCLGREEEEYAARVAHEGEHDIDQALAASLHAFAARRLGPAWRFFERDFADAAAAAQLAVPWAIYHHRVEGVTACERYLDERGSSLGLGERRWLAAQQRAWLSVWEVTSVQPGESLTLRDLLAGETRCVREATASRTLVVRDAVLARVVDGESASLLCGLYPRALPPRAAAEVVRRARGRLRRRRDVPVDRLQDHAFGRYLIRCWEQAVDALDAELATAAAYPPDLRNTDGESFLLTTDHFEVAPNEVAAVEERLAAMPNVDPPDRGAEPRTYVFLREQTRGERTVLGCARLAGSRLRIETNSRERADAMRAAVERACGERIRHRARDHADPFSERAPMPSPERLPPDAQELVLEFKRRHYARWPDQPLPALSGSTPRQAARTAAGRATLDLLMKEMEHWEQRASRDAPFDFSGIRRELGLD